MELLQSCAKPPICSSKPCHHWLNLVQIMTWCLFGAKPLSHLSEPIWWFINLSLGIGNQSSFSHTWFRMHQSSCKKMYLKQSSDKCWSFCLSLLGSIPCLLLRWLLKSAVHQQAWCWLRRTVNIYCCSRINFICLCQSKSKVKFQMWIYLL